MNNNLEKFIQKNRREFDTESPSESVWNAIEKNVPAKTNINLTDYNRGVYIYQVRDHDGKVVESGKFQVSK